jgi:tRNA A-37 threonylcarbamoyl transferase component Bud32
METLAALQPDAVFAGRYRVVQAIKAGGMGAVYEVLDEVTNARRALKTMLPSVVEDGDMRARFALEARITGDVESDHIVRVFHAGVDDATGMPFLVMELLRGRDLGAELKARGRLPPDEIASYLAQAAGALDRTHAAGIVHRDLKPDNLFVTRRDDGSPCVKILDYGIAKVLAQSNHTSATQTLGTPAYMSPEQVRGKGGIGPAADVYALGHIAYALLVGEPYWEEEKRSGESLFPLFTAIVAGAPEPPLARALRRRGVELPTGFDAWFARSTALDPGARFPAATEAVAALAPALDTPTARLIQVAADVAAEGRMEQRVMPGRMVAMTVGLGAALFVLVTVGVQVLRAPPPSTKAAPSAEPPASMKEVVDALFLVSIGDFAGAHAKVLAIPEDLRPVDDPGFQGVEQAWADWKLRQAARAEGAKRREILREVATTGTVDSHLRKKAAVMLQEMDAK